MIINNYVPSQKLPMSGESMEEVNTELDKLDNVLEVVFNSITSSLVVSSRLGYYYHLKYSQKSQYAPTILYHSMQSQPKETIIIYHVFTITTMIFYLQALSVDVHKAKKLAKCGHELILEHAFAR